uniref:mRNA export factor GLE1 n=1 Tax=Mucochytrium quahogii TaxID=96639 RepID=A0A7S2WQC2_9STRA|mmetsp:Transcript_28993/g.46774  ORF Transcript_28993/g.46774 Transcript_28993/m.46774 type:complete len:488 (-) Transcript_28993:2294-3757(-)
MERLQEDAVSARIAALKENMEANVVLERFLGGQVVCASGQDVEMEWDSQATDTYRRESDMLLQRIETLKVQLYERNKMLQEAEKLKMQQQAEAERSRRKAEEDAREAAQRKHQMELAAAKLKSEEAQKLAEEKRIQKERKAATEKRVKALVALALTRRKKYIEREEKTEWFSKKFKKKVNGCRMIIQKTGETVAALKLGLTGNRKYSGAGTFLDQLKQDAPDMLPYGMQFIASTIVTFAGSNTAPDSIKAGETKYAMVYLAVILSINYDGFYEQLLETVNFMCPYAWPGLREAIVRDMGEKASQEDLKSALGYKPGEQMADYIARMQAIVGFLAGVYQTSVDMLEKEPFVLVPAGSKHPEAEGGIVQAWRWVSLSLNHEPFRWTPYLLQAFLAVSGFELSRHCGKQMKKLAKLLGSENFATLCRKKGNFNEKLTDNDVDRMRAYVEFFKRVEENGWKFSVPGKPTENKNDPVLDIRQLVLDVAVNES